MTKYKRNAQIVLDNLFENSAGQVIAKRDCKIHIPVRFTEIGLGQIGISTFTYGLFAIILDTGEYSVCNVNALIELNPLKTVIITINDVEYYEFSFEANQVVIKTTDLLQRNRLMYNAIDEFIFKGKVPWYVDYEDLGKFYDTAKYHAGSGVGDVQEIAEFIAAMVTRSATDKSKYIRNVADSYSDISIDKIEYVPLMSVYYSVGSTLNKLAGSYFNEGVTSALVNKTERVDKIERILRS